MITLNVNGKAHDLDVSPQMPLLWVLRDHLNLTGTKYGCGRALCGTCTVHINGEAARSCSIMAGDAIRLDIVTIEGVSGKVADVVKGAWRDLDVPQCGYCQPGQIMTVVNLLSTNSAPTDADIDTSMYGNICRCGTYVRIRAAIHQAAKTLAEGGA